MPTLSDQPVFTILIIFVLAVLSKIVYYHFWLVRAKSLLHVYSEEMQTEGGNYWKVAEYQSEIVRLFRAAKVTEGQIAYVQPLGFGTVSNNKASTWENLAVPNSEIFSIVKHHFHIAIGYFRARRNEALTPGYWIDLLIFWPQHVLGYIGVPVENLFSKLFQVTIILVEFIAGAVFLYDRFLTK